MSFEDTTAYLYGLRNFGMKFGLDNIQSLLGVLGDPQKSFLSVHVAGTNGKGSTSAMTESILRSAGVRTGLFTSPHLVSFTERIRIDGREISENDVVRLADVVRKAAESLKDVSPTFFEVVTAMAFVHFRETDVKWAVIETGLGGRLDATNAIEPEVSVITPISFDHREFLGDTLPEIAREKAGIIKQGVPVVSAAQQPEALHELETRAVEKKTDICVCGRDFSSRIISDAADGLEISYSGSREYESIRIPLRGTHQAANAALAAKTAEILMERFPELRCNIKGGIESVFWPGRLEQAGSKPDILLDGAHNPDASSALARYLTGRVGGRYGKVVVVAGIMADKDVDGILAPLLRCCDEIIFTSPSYARAASAETLLRRAEAAGFSGKTSGSVSEALRMAAASCGEGDLIVVTGSFYTIGEAKECLTKPGVLSGLRE